jgi:hypothetical protein
VVWVLVEDQIKISFVFAKSFFEVGIKPK